MIIYDFSTTEVITKASVGQQYPMIFFWNCNIAIKKSIIYCNEAAALENPDYQ